MKFEKTSLPGVVVVEPQVFGDSRGYFCETWHARKFTEGGIDTTFVQENQSRSARGVLRGLHYQIRQAQGKLVRCVEGTLFDVAVDLRRSSPTFGKWFGTWLSDENRRQLWIPPGFGHGFYVTSPFATMVYLCSDIYAPEHDRSIRWDDPAIGIEWPLLPGEPPLLSAKDLAAKPLADADVYP